MQSKGKSVMRAADTDTRDDSQSPHPHRISLVQHLRSSDRLPGLLTIFIFKGVRTTRHSIHTVPYVSSQPLSGYYTLPTQATSTISHT
jgi:hypothetical protein